MIKNKTTEKNHLPVVSVLLSPGSSDALDIVLHCRLGFMLYFLPHLYLFSPPWIKFP